MSDFQADTHCHKLNITSPQEPFWARINKVRNNELGILWKSFIIDATNGWA